MPFDRHESLAVAVLFSAVFLLCFRHSAHAADFCVADLSLHTPSGYACKDPTKVTAADFLFAGISRPGNTTNPNMAVAAPAFVQQFPALNGLGVSMARADFAPGGVIPLHTHPAATEMAYLVEGTLTVGFVAAGTNKVYVNTAKKGEVTVFPQGMPHFVVNADTKRPAVALVAFSSPEPGNLLVSSALFGNDLASALVEKTTGISEAEVKRLKALLGGSG
ncbi:Germin-like protein [Linum grandiflorum]